MKYLLTCALLLSATLVQGQGATPSNDEIWKELQVLKKENQSLRKLVTKANDAAEAAVTATENAGHGTGALSNVNIGGYGELHYNNLEDQNGNADKTEIDFHRFVLFFGHEFADDLRFFSEFELEHSIAGEGKNGEIELEQAYIEYDINDKHQLTGGLFLIPVGIINETHEPATFYGTERNPVEKNIIPATWWEGGLMASGELARGIYYDAALTSGLNTSAGSNFAICSGRQKASKAEARNLAFTGRIKWTAIPGIEVGTTVQHQTDIAQGLDLNTGSATLIETHIVLARGKFSLRALSAAWELQGPAPAAVGANEQVGYYVEPSYRITKHFGVFARYNEWDNQAGDNIDSVNEEISVGINWWPHKDVVVKLDYQDQDVPPGQKELDGFNVGLGYQF